MIFLLQETKNSNLFDKSCTQENVKCHIMFRLYFLKGIVLAHFQSLFGKVIVCILRK